MQGLAQLATLNPDILSVAKAASFTEHRIFIELKQTPAPFLRDGCLEWRSEHRITLLLGRLFPAIPFEPYIEDPPFHPNISPDDGFICLWEEFDPRRSAVDGIIALRNILTWQNFNPHDVHLMQPEALRYSDRFTLDSLPEWPRLKLPDSEASESLIGGVGRCGHRFDVLDGDTGILG